MTETKPLRRTPLFDLHQELGANMVPFAGYDMPVQYPLGVMKEHLHCRAAAGLFDVSHMGQLRLVGESYQAVAEALEGLLPMDVLGLPEGRQRYGFFTNEHGGIEDDLMFANRGDHIFLVVNAARKEADIALLKSALEPDIKVQEITDRALIALQGPAAETSLAQLNPKIADMRFMDVMTVDLAGAECWVSRSGYTGEDGFEISVPTSFASVLCREILAQDAVLPIGLGARDSLRLEAGLCLYGNDMTAETSPITAGLTWAIQKARRAGGVREGGFPGASHILSELAEGVARKRVGLLPEGRAPMRAGTEIFATEDERDPIGAVTSGGFGPTCGAPVAMGYVGTSYAQEGKQLFGEVRGRRLPLRVAKLPFVPANFKR